MPLDSEIAHPAPVPSDRRRKFKLLIYFVLAALSSWLVIAYLILPLVQKESGSRSHISSGSL
jgi:hypothetical protein